MRVLITRYRPRGVKKGSEPWDRWDKRLAPSVELLDTFFGKRREGRKVVATDLPRLPWKKLVKRYHEEMRDEEALAALAEYRELAAKKAVTFLCYCEDETRCHRSLARDLVG